MEKRAILAIVLSLVVVVIWSIMFAPHSKVPPEGVSESPPSTTPESLPAAPPQTASREVQMPVAPAVTPAAATAPAVEVMVDTGVARLTLTGQAAGVKSVQLHHFRTSLAHDAPPVEIAPVKGSSIVPLTAELLSGPQSAPLSLGKVVFTPDAAAPLLLSAEHPQGTVTFRAQLLDGLTVQRIYRFAYNSYTFEVETRLAGRQSQQNDALLLLWGPGLLEHTDEKTRRGQTAVRPRGYVGNKVRHETSKTPVEFREYEGEVTWAALGDTYFAAVLLPTPATADAMIIRQPQAGASTVGVRFPLDTSHMAPTARVYVGPKKQSVLVATEPSLDKLIDLGFFSPLARPMMQLLGLVYRVVHNYGVAIILVTILIKMALWPLTQTSYKSMQGMQKLQPKMKELQALYKDDKQGLNRATMQLYKEQKVNPMGGCLPMVFQIPVFFAFYNSLLYSVELRHAPFICWDTPLLWGFRGICDLSVYDPSYITPILMGVTMFLQQKMTPTTADPTQAKVMQFMPLIFLIFFLSAPAGLVLYWLMNNILSIVQQTLVNRTRQAETARAQAAR